ncbi:hypothetical protein UPYG_G00295500 [Umbra pygmaea]|uniref:Fibronectin type-III domain-containing protein n=1 Tax=Umbra pygmaea TaxID=75934 RepID=A0ABD0WA61_UMBPY
MHCGQHYNLTITAMDSTCSSSYSNITLQSVPCAPRNIQTNQQCITNSTTVTWDRGSGALYYLAVGASGRGSMTSCKTNDTHCDLEGLQCGQVYNVSVSSLDGVCMSSPAVSSDLQTAPCPPQNVKAQVECSSNTMEVSWDPNPDADWFLVDAVTGGGSKYPCNTTDTQCILNSLPCGDSFTVLVTAVRGVCYGLPSQALTISSAPCMPTVVNSSLNCVTHSAWVVWAPAQGADIYTVTANGVGGLNSSCSASSTTCEVPDLACGVLYTFYITASNGNCDSPHSKTFNIETAPCTLASISASSQCNSTSIHVLWQPKGDRLTNNVYIVTAEASDLSVLTCNSSATSCDLQGATCDLQYTIVVSASSDICSGLRSPPLKINMEPCPQDVVITSRCKSHGADVSWALSPVADTYLMTAIDGNGGVRSCNSTTNNCSLSGLKCSHQYTVSVSASNQNCSSTASQNVTFNTVPCEPDNVSVSVQCANNTALLSWAARAGAVGYWGSAQAEDGTVLYCESTKNSCTIGGLQCGAQYNFSVQASDGICNSSLSKPLLAGAVPCPPNNVVVIMLPVQSQTQYLRASWSHVPCSNVQYLLEVTGSILGDSQSLFDVFSYWTSSFFFELLLPCGSSYNATVRSGNSAGVSAPSWPVTGTTAPCPPQLVTYSGTNTSATISWNASVYATNYTVYDISGVQAEVCSTVLLSCSIPNLNYSNLVVTASNAAGESNPTGVISVHLSRRRRDLNEDKMVSVTGLAMPEVQVTLEMPTNLLVEWSPVEGAAYYSLMIKEQRARPRHASQPQIRTVYGNSIIVRDLKPSTTYCLSMSAQTDASQGPFSEPVCVETGSPVFNI